MLRALSVARTTSVLGLSWVLLIQPAAVRAQYAESDLMLLAVRLDGRFERVLLEEVVASYAVGDRVLVPLGELSRMLDLGIRVDPMRGMADGFVLREEQTFHVDVAEGTVRVDEKSFLLEPGDVEARDDDLYVDTEVLGRWLPIDLLVDRRDMVLAIRPRELLPRELRRLRELEASKILATAGEPSAAYPEMRVPYALWEVPFADLNLLLRSQPDERGERGTQAAFSTEMTSDLLYMESRLFAAGNEDGISDARFSLGRMDPEGRLLGFMGAREIVFGEALSPGLDLISLSRSGPGVLLSNFPLQQPIRFDEHTFQGDVPVGWEIELYRNDALIDYQRAGEDGRYLFEGVPLLFGRNVFRLAFYGPHGERREEQQVFNIGQSLTTPGRLYYRAVFNEPRDTEPRSAAELDLGVHRHLSVNLAAAVIGHAEGQNRYARAGVRGFRGPLSFTFDMAWDREGDRTVKAAVQTGFGPLGLSLQHARLESFDSEIFEPTFGPIRSRSLVRLDGAVPLGRRVSLPLLFQWRRDGLESGEGVHYLTNRLFSFYRGLSVTSELQRVFAEGEGPVENSTQGLLFLSRYTPRFAVRGEMAYDLEPAREVTGLTLSLEGWIGSEYRGSLGVLRRFREDATHLLLGANKMEGNYGFGLLADYSGEQGFAGSLSLTIALTRDSRTGRWDPDAKPTARSGGVSARVFVDADADGIMDSGESPLEGVGISADGLNLPSRTGRDGTVFLDGLSAHRGVNLTVSPGTLEDPFWMPGKTGVRLIPRPGKVARVDFPIVATGEITGTVYIQNGQDAREAAGMRLELLDEAGAVMREVKTASDGFYDIAGIPPGGYWLRISPDQLRAQRLLSPPPIPVRVEGAEGVVFDGLDIRLELGPLPAP